MVRVLASVSISWSSYSRSLSSFAGLLSLFIFLEKQITLGIELDTEYRRPDYKSRIDKSTREAIKAAYFPSTSMTTD